MAYRITKECTGCGACIMACPVDAIKEGLINLMIETTTCIQCGACAAECPFGAIEAK